MIKFETRRMVMKAEQYDVVDGKLKFFNPNKEIDLFNLKPITSFVFYDKENEDCKICHIGIREDRRHMEIGYGVEEKFRGKKYMKEALSSFIEWIFTNTEENELNALISDNPESQHILESCGFVEDGQFDYYSKWYTLKK